MISLVAQITTASRHAMREAAQLARAESLKAERLAAARAKQWASRKAGGNGIADELLKILPPTRETAINMPAIKQALNRFDFRDSSISSSLSGLVKAKRVQRTGEKREYRYYLAEGKKP